MPIQLICGGCQKSYTLKSELAGKKVRCKACGTILSVPAQSAAVSAEPSKPRVTPPPPPLPPPLVKPQPVSNSKLAAIAPPTDLRNNLGFKSLMQGIWTALVIIGVLGVLGLRAYRKMNADSAPSTPAAWIPSPVAATVPPRPALTNIDGYQTATVTLTNRIGLPTTVKVYLPPGTHAPGSLSCVMVAPAGSGVIFGMSLGEGDYAEQIPYVRAGFAVIAYSLSGEPVGGLQNTTYANLKTAAEQFHAAGGGVIDAGDALTYALERFPEINAARIGCAGHSSAGLHTLLLSRNEPRIKACAAYAPSLDPVDHVNKYFGELKPFLPSLDSWAAEYSPTPPRVPTLLFAARDDEACPFERAAAFASANPKIVTFKPVDSGGHYASMIQQGIPAGIAFFREKLR